MTTPAPEDSRNSTGATLRSGLTAGQWLGIVLALGDVALLVLDAVVIHEQTTWPDVALHVGVLALAIFLIYPNKFLALVQALPALISAVKNKLPFVGGGGGGS